MAGVERTTIDQLIEDLAALGSRPAVGLRLDLGLRWWNYERLHRETKRAACALAACGVLKGDRVTIQAPNCPEWVGLFLGLLQVGAVAVPIEHDALPEVVDRIAAVVQPRLRLSASDLETIFRPGAPQASPIPCIPCTGYHDTDPAVIFFTSGTTSAPRGVMLTHGNLIAQVARFKIWRRAARLIPVRMVVMAPLSHAQGIMVGVLIPLFLGVSVIYTHSSHPAHLMRVLRDNRVLVLSTLPRVLHLLGHAFLDQQYGNTRKTLRDKLKGGRPWMMRRHFIFSNMRRSIGYGFWVVLVGGAPLPEPDERFWRDSGCLLVQGYGLTETTAVVSVNLPMLGRFGSVGKPLDGQDLVVDGDGEIMVRGANVIHQYFGEAAASQNEWTRGYLRTGDIGYLDSSNRLFILGRKKEVIITGEGFNVYAGDIEGALNSVAGVRDSVVLGVGRDGHTEVHAVLLLDSHASAVEVVRQANQRLLTNQRVASWTVWPEQDFPRGSLLKPKRGDIQDQVRCLSAASSQRRSTEEPAKEPSVDELMSIEDKRARIHALAHFVVHDRRRVQDQEESTLGEMGLTSLDTVELLTAIEKCSGMLPAGASVGEGMTLRDLHDLVRNPFMERRTRGIDVKNAPRWAESRLLKWPRQVLNPLVLLTYADWRTTVEVNGIENLKTVTGPVILMGIGHEHAFDVLLIYRALPPPMRRMLAIVASRWVFTHVLEPEAETPWTERTKAALGFYFLVPLFFPMALSSPFGRARDGLMDAGRLIDRGFSLISFKGKGVGLVARQCGIPVIPVRLSGNDHLDFSINKPRRRVTVRFGKPIQGGEAEFDDE